MMSFKKVSVNQISIKKLLQAISLENLYLAPSDVVVIVVPLPARRSRRARRGTARAATNTRTASRRRLAIDDDIRPACCGCVSRCARDCDAWRRRYLVDASDDLLARITAGVVGDLETRP